MNSGISKKIWFGGSMEKISIFISGDFCPIHQAEEVFLNDFDEKRIFDDFEEIIQKSDISVTNLESPLTQINEPIGKSGPNFRTDPEIAKTIKETGFDLVTLANNHIYDQGEDGLNETITSLVDQDLEFVGAGNTLSEAQTPFYISIKGLKIAFINFSLAGLWCANENHGGSNSMNLIDNFNQIRSANQNADIVILIIHGGHEHQHYPSPETIKRYRFYAQSGADAIVAHHPHSIQGYEVYEETPIFYSLGNFLFPPYRDKDYEKHWFEGYAVVLKIKDGKINFKILPYEQCNNEEISITPKSKESEIYNRIEKISNKLDDEEFIKSKFEDYVENKKENDFLKRWMGFNLDYILYSLYILKNHGFSEFLKIFNGKRDMQLLNKVLNHQTQREIANKILEDYLNKL